MLELKLAENYQEQWWHFPKGLTRLYVTRHASWYFLRQLSQTTVRGPGVEHGSQPAVLSIKKPCALRDLLIASFGLASTTSSNCTSPYLDFASLEVLALCCHLFAATLPPRTFRSSLASIGDFNGTFDFASFSSTSSSRGVGWTFCPTPRRVFLDFFFGLGSVSKTFDGLFTGLGALCEVSTKTFLRPLFFLDLKPIALSWAVQVAWKSAWKLVHLAFSFVEDENG